jgi:hypothetical protein
MSTTYTGDHLIIWNNVANVRPPLSTSIPPAPTIVPLNSQGNDTDGADNSEASNHHRHAVGPEETHFIFDASVDGSEQSTNGLNSERNAPQRPNSTTPINDPKMARITNAFQKFSIDELARSYTVADFDVKRCGSFILERDKIQFLINHGASTVNKNFLYQELRDVEKFPGIPLNIVEPLAKKFVFVFPKAYFSTESKTFLDIDMSEPAHLAIVILFQFFVTALEMAKKEYYANGNMECPVEMVLEMLVGKESVSAPLTQETLDLILSDPHYAVFAKFNLENRACEGYRIIFTVSSALFKITDPANFNILIRAIIATHAQMNSDGSQVETMAVPAMPGGGGNDPQAPRPKRAGFTKNPNRTGLAPLNRDFSARCKFYVENAKQNVHYAVTSMMEYNNILSAYTGAQKLSFHQVFDFTQTILCYRQENVHDIQSGKTAAKFYLPFPQYVGNEGAALNYPFPDVTVVIDPDLCDKKFLASFLPHYTKNFHRLQYNAKKTMKRSALAQTGSIRYSYGLNTTPASGASPVGANQYVEDDPEMAEIFDLLPDEEKTEILNLRKAVLTSAPPLSNAYINSKDKSKILYGFMRPCGFAQWVDAYADDLSKINAMEDLQERNQALAALSQSSLLDFSQRLFVRNAEYTNPVWQQLVTCFQTNDDVRNCKYTVVRTDSSLGVLGNHLKNLMILYQHISKIATVHSELLMLHYAMHSTYRTHFGLRNHVMLCGDAMLSKSYMMNVEANNRVKGTVKFMDSMTPKAMLNDGTGDNVQLDDVILFFDDANPLDFQANTKDPKKSESQARMKAWMTRASFYYMSLSTGNGDRSTQEVWLSARCTLGFNANIYSLEYFEKALASRMLVHLLHERTNFDKRTATNAGTQADKGESALKDKSALQMYHWVEQIIIATMCKLSSNPACLNVVTRTTDETLLVVENVLKEKYQIEVSPRAREQVMNFAHTFTCLTAMLQNWFCENSVYAGQEISIEQFFNLRHLTVDNPEVAAFSISIALRQHIDSKQWMVLNMIDKICSGHVQARHFASISDTEARVDSLVRTLDILKVNKLKRAYYKSTIKSGDNSGTKKAGNKTGPDTNTPSDNISQQPGDNSFIANGFLKMPAPVKQTNTLKRKNSDNLDTSTVAEYSNNAIEEEEEDDDSDNINNNNNNNTSRGKHNNNNNNIDHDDNEDNSNNNNNNTLDVVDNDKNNNSDKKQKTSVSRNSKSDRYVVINDTKRIPNNNTNTDQNGGYDNDDDDNEDEQDYCVDETNPQPVHEYLAKQDQTYVTIKNAKDLNELAGLIVSYQKTLTKGEHYEYMLDKFTVLNVLKKIQSRKLDTKPYKFDRLGSTRNTSVTDLRRENSFDASELMRNNHRSANNELNRHASMPPLSSSDGDEYNRSGSGSGNEMSSTAMSISRWLSEKSDAHVKTTEAFRILNNKIYINVSLFSITRSNTIEDALEHAMITPLDMDTLPLSVTNVEIPTSYVLAIPVLGFSHLYQTLPLKRHTKQISIYNAGRKTDVESFVLSNVFSAERGSDNRMASIDGINETASSKNTNKNSTQNSLAATSRNAAVLHCFETFDVVAIKELFNLLAIPLAASNVLKMHHMVLSYRFLGEIGDLKGVVGSTSYPKDIIAKTKAQLVIPTETLHLSQSSAFLRDLLATEKKALNTMNAVARAKNDGIINASERSASHWSVPPGGFSKATPHRTNNVVAHPETTLKIQSQDINNAAITNKITRIAVKMNVDPNNITNPKSIDPVLQLLEMKSTETPKKPLSLTRFMHSATKTAINNIDLSEDMNEVSREDNGDEESYDNFYQHNIETNDASSSVVEEEEEEEEEEEGEEEEGGEEDKRIEYNTDENFYNELF